MCQHLANDACCILCGVTQSRGEIFGAIVQNGGNLCVGGASGVRAEDKICGMCQSSFRSSWGHGHSKRFGSCWQACPADPWQLTLWVGRRCVWNDRVLAGITIRPCPIAVPTGRHAKPFHSASASRSIPAFERCRTTNAMPPSESSVGQ